MVMIDGAVWERAKNVYLSEKFKIAIFTGQKLISDQPSILLNDNKNKGEVVIHPNYSKNKELRVSGERVYRNAASIALPFNVLSQGQLDYCRSIAEGMSLIDIKVNANIGEICIGDVCTLKTTSIPLSALDDDVIKSVVAESYAKDAKPPRVIR